MSSIWVVGTVFTTLGFGIGGIIAMFLKGVQKQTDAVYSICAGLILGLISFEVAPEAIKLGNWITFSFGILIGVVIYQFIHKSFKVLLVPAKSGAKRSSLYTGMMLMIFITFHNLPIGIILGSNQEATLSLSILKTIFLHNIPEGIIVFTPLFMAGLGIWTLVFFSIIVALPVGLGAYFGSTLHIDNPFFWSVFISMSIGMIYMVTVKEILTDSIKASTSIRVFLLAAIGFCCIGAYFVFI
ncbi:ZIP family metal transporter [Paenisporosarcina sp. TG-14]|uniref:ZIP family metal transporter n=1 Tax=Paenisporosarcina sp. TG-14 TaxID=1231057 RepID=UPI00037DC654|nr:ZIP family metal transporter [Paenisporosarcina sp. TG-14]